LGQCSTTFESSPAMTLVMRSIVRVVARVDPLMAIAEADVIAALEAAEALDFGPPHLLGDPRIDGAFIDNRRLAGGVDHCGDRARRGEQGVKVRTIVRVDRGRDGDDIDAGPSADPTRRQSA